MKARPAKRMCRENEPRCAKLSLNFVELECRCLILLSCAHRERARAGIPPACARKHRLTFPRLPMLCEGEPQCSSLNSGTFQSPSLCHACLQRLKQRCRQQGTRNSLCICRACVISTVASSAPSALRPGCFAAQLVRASRGRGCRPQRTRGSL